MSSIPYHLQKKLSYTDGALYSLMVGMGETYVAAYVLAAGFSELSSGVVTVLPMFIGAVLQLFANYAVEYFKSRKRWVVMATSMQATSLVLLALSSLLHWPVYAVYAFVGLYWASGMAAGPSWNVWITNTIPKEKTIEFFAGRSRVCTTATLVGIFLGGIWLQVFKTSEAFSALFFMAATVRFMSSYTLSMQPRAQNDKKYFEHTGFLKNIKWAFQKDNFSIFAFIFFLQSSVYVASPFFNPFIIKKLEFSYIELMYVLCISTLSKTLSFTYLQDLARKNGVRALLVFGTIGIMPLPFLWSFIDTSHGMAAAMFLNGVSWASYELGLLLTILDGHTDQERNKMLSVLNLLNASGQMTGLAIGSLFINLSHLELSDYQHAFWFSSILRVLPILMLFVVAKKEVKSAHMYFRIMGVHLGGGLIVKPMLYMNEKIKKGTDQIIHWGEK